MLKAFIHIKVTEQHKYNSNMNYKIYPRKKTNLHCIYGEKNITKIPFKTDVSNVILYHHKHANGTGPFQKSGMKFHCLQGLYQTMSFKDITLKEIEKKP